jgi:acyl carrier protein
MKQVKEFRDSRDWEKIGMNLAEQPGTDEEQAATIADLEGESLDLVETSMALEAAFGSRLLKRPKS